MKPMTLEGHPQFCPCEECDDMRRWFFNLILEKELADEPLALEIAQKLLEEDWGVPLEGIMSLARILAGYS